MCAEGMKEQNNTILNIFSFFKDLSILLAILLAITLYIHYSKAHIFNPEDIKKQLPACLREQRRVLSP